MESDQLSRQWAEKTGHFLKSIRAEIFQITGSNLEKLEIESKDNNLLVYLKGKGDPPWSIIPFKDTSLQDAYPMLYKHFKKQLQFLSLPWGGLQGVRPTKLMHRQLESGLSVDEAISYMVSKYDLEFERARLLGEIATVQREYLKKIPNSIGLYIGIPFCPSRCLYCSFPGEVLPQKQQEMEVFLNALAEDMNAVSQWIKKNNVRISSLYIGGGTPTSLPDVLFEQLLSQIHFNFDLSELTEFSLEAGRPETLSKEKLRLAFSAGIRRISVNPQSMHQETLDKIGRNHKIEEIISAYYETRSRGFSVINMDLIAGLPEEATLDFMDSLKRIVDLKPENITIHSLALKKGSKWLEQNQNAPCGSIMREMVENGRSYLSSRGWKPYYLYRQRNSPGHLENIGYAVSGTESLYNIQMMEETHTIIGMGPGSATKKQSNRGRISSYHFPKERKLYQENIHEYLKRRSKILENDFE